ncbi:MAG: hypothetical protein QNJ51_01895 [Calothrix sp. MO_167.B12]|nr:hypothetical protein [Calothrix sp. MO_167.B12]
MPNPIAKGTLATVPEFRPTFGRGNRERATGNSQRLLPLSSLDPPVGSKPHPFGTIALDGV